jgi:PAS domain S-box-containing protein
MARSEVQTLQSVLDQIQDYAIITLDPAGVIRGWNQGAERLKGYRPDEIIGRSFEIFYPIEDRQAGLPGRLLAEARRLGRVQHDGWRLRRDGTRFWADVLITALRDDAGRLTGFVKVTRDLTEQHALQESLRASEERFRLLVSQVTDYAIIALDPQGIIQSWNLGAERVKGWTAEEAIGRSFEMFYSSEDRSAGLPARLLDEAKVTGGARHTGWRMRKDGSRFWAEVVITALHDEHGRLTGYAKVTRDRTDTKVLEEAQDAFYAAFDHDFRTPLTALKGFAEAILDADGEMRVQMVDRISASADHLLEMVEGLMSFATRRGGDLPITLEPVDLAALSRSVAQDLSPGLNPQRVRVASGSALARANWHAMYRVVTNLLVNALKYSSQDSEVVVDFAYTDDGQTQLTVRDNGRGIAEEDLDRIFEAFERGRLAQNDGGTGLGLTSVRDLVHQQNGILWLDSEVGTGTTVTVELPAAFEVGAGPDGAERERDGGTSTVPERGRIGIPRQPRTTGQSGG